MSSANLSQIPTYLRDLDCSSPSSWRKLIAAWNGLNVETQIMFLNHIKQNNLQSDVKKDLYKLAIESNNSYVRYLGAKELLEYQQCEITENQIKNDPSELVKYCRYELSKYCPREYLDPSEALPIFYDLPHEGRLAFLRKRFNTGLLCRIIEETATTEEKEVSWIQIKEFLADLVSKEKVRKYFEYFYPSEDYMYEDGMSEYLKGKELERLWKTIAKIPNAYYCSEFIEKFPIETNNSFDIYNIEELLNKLPDSHLEVLFFREDIRLFHLRKEVFFDEKKEENVKSAAIQYNFNLSPIEFGNYLQKIKKEKDNSRIISLSDLGLFASDLSLWLYAATIEEIESGSFDWDWEYIPGIISNMKKIFKKLQMRKAVI